ncbi:MAG: hypothetical protein Q8909_04335 [Bacteroidota bacterium]|nr:hypothetical protein [Bacteroidota bacterium]
MKRTTEILAGLTGLGIIISFLVLPFGKLLSVISIVTLTAIAITRLIKEVIKKEPSVIQRLYELTCILWLLVLISRIMFWEIGKPIYYISILMSIGTLTALISRNERLELKGIIITSLLIFGGASGWLHSYTFFKYTNIHILTGEDIRAKEHDRYSYYLFLGGKTEEGIIEGEKALQQSIKETGENSQETNYFRNCLEQRKRGNIVY